MNTSDSAAPSRRRRNRGLEAALFVLAIIVVGGLVLGTISVRQARQERAALRRLWRLGTVISFEGDEEYTNPPLTPSEWDAEFARNWLDDLAASRPKHVLFVRFAPAANWPGPVVDDADIPELIEILRALPSITRVKLDKNITLAGRTLLESALPGIRFSMPPRIP